MWLEGSASKFISNKGATGVCVKHVAFVICHLPDCRTLDLFKFQVLLCTGSSVLELQRFELLVCSIVSVPQEDLEFSDQLNVVFGFGVGVEAHILSQLVLP